MRGVSKILLTFGNELFDSIAPQNAEIRTITKSLLLKFKNSAKGLFLNWLCQTDENLKYHSVNVNAILTKAEAQKHYIRLLMKKQKVQKPEALFNDHSVKEMYTEMETAYVRLYQLGYRKMPEEMYMQWIGLLNKESGKYINTHIRLE